MVKEVKKYISPLLDSGLNGNHLSIAFDIRMFHVEKALLESGNLNSVVKHVKNIRLVAPVSYTHLAILDPAMGSAGFLLSSAAYINEHQQSEKLKSENNKYFKSGLFSGFDTDQSMLRIGAMNMMLHGVDAVSYTHLKRGDLHEKRI